MIHPGGGESARRCHRGPEGRAQQRLEPVVPHQLGCDSFATLSVGTVGVGLALTATLASGAGMLSGVQMLH